MNRAIVIGCQETGLAISEALASKGIKILVIPKDKTQIGRYSRFVDEKSKIFDPVTNKEELLDYLKNVKPEWDDSLIIVSGDEGISFVSENLQSLLKRFIPTISDPKIILSILNKEHLYEQARNVGIPVPNFFIPNCLEDIRLFKNNISYPCIIKPVMRHKSTPIFKKKLIIAEDLDNVLEHYEELLSHNLRAIIMEIIPGEDDTLFHYRSYIDRNGEVTAEMCTQKLRQNPPNFGVARISKTIPMINEIKNLSLKLLNSYSYKGVSSAEFKYDFRDSKYKLIEINARPVGPERLFYTAGINFPYIAYLDCVERKSLRVNDYETELYWISNFQDVKEFFTGRKLKNYKLREYFKPYFYNKTFEVPFKNDPFPFVAKIYYSTVLLLKMLFNKCYNSIFSIVTKTISH